ncbi:MAG TPA: ATP-binding protein, partial [Acidimicrobiales bacterium]|nr:ATP-binding protein [Acidimicrobiales bacterium]
MSRDDTASSPVPQPGPGVWVLTLPSEHRSVSVARRAVTRHLEQVGLDDIVAAAQLVVSELVANAVLHAGGDVRVEVELIPDGARVAVIDHSHVLPVSAAPSESSMTGRGLQLVQRVAAELGAVATADGKRIWADLVVGWEPVDERVGNPLELWGEEWPDDPSAEILVPVELADVPTGVLLAAKAHVDNLLRECTLATAGADQGVAAGVPLELARRVAAAVGGFADARMAMKRQALAAARAQQPRVALRLALPPSRAAAAASYVAAIEEADAYCEAARLLTLASPPTHRVFRRWYVSEVIAQLEAGGTGGPGPTRTFEEALLGEVERLATSTAAAERAGRLAAVTDALARAGTPEAVSTAVLREGVAALGASGGGILLAAGERRLAVPGTVGYDDDLVRRLTDESPD